MFLLVFITLFHALLLVARSVPYDNSYHIHNWKPIGIGLVVAIPQCLLLMAYTFLAFYWLAIYHFAMQQHRTPFGHVRGPFIFVNLLSSGVVIILTLMAAGVNSTSQSTQIIDVEVVTGFVAVINIITAIVFSIYGWLLMGQMVRSSSSAIILVILLLLYPKLNFQWLNLTRRDIKVQKLLFESFKVVKSLLLHLLFNL